MNAKQWAKRLNGREYGNELSREEEQQANADGVLIIYGYSDDNIELRGVIRDEVGAYNGTTFRVDSTGILPTWEQMQDGDFREDEVEEYFKRKLGGLRTVKAEWSKDGYSWLISIDCHFEPFEIMEEGDKFCRGIVVEERCLN